MFLESAFSICVGCWIYKKLIDKEPEHCPGGVCEVRVREPIQTFNPMQKLIAIVTVTGLVVGIYLFLAKTESKTFFGEFLHEMVLTDAQLEHEEELKMEAEFNEDDDDF